MDLLCYKSKGFAYSLLSRRDEAIKTCSCVFKVIDSMNSEVPQLNGSA